MSRIDGYKHELLGFIECKSDYNFVYLSQTRNIAIYRLKEDVPYDETSFDGKTNDILVGGGQGEAAAMRISYPSAFRFFCFDDFDDFDGYDELFKTFWSPTDSFNFGNGYLKSNWNPKVELDYWLAEEICKLLSTNFTEFSEFKNENMVTDLKFTKDIRDTG